MINQLIKNTISTVSTDEDELELAIYGIKIIASNILTFIILLSIGFLVREPISALIYLGVLVSLRRNMGGYHSKTYLGCLSITSLNFIIIAVIGKLLSFDLKEIIGIILIIYSSIKIHISKPVVHKNRIVKKDTIQISNKRKDRWLNIILISATILYVITRLELMDMINHFFAISSSLMVVAVTAKSE